MPREKQVLIYLAGDYLAALLSWTCFFLYRQALFEGQSVLLTFTQLPASLSFLWGILLIPLFWVSFYYITGFYKDIYRKSRLAEVWSTLLVTLAGSVILFLLLIPEEVSAGYHLHFRSLLLLTAVHYCLTIIWRISITTFAKEQLKHRKVGFNTLIIGSNKKAIDLYKEIDSKEKSLGYKFVGFIEVNGNGTNGLQRHLTRLGRLKDVNRIIRKHRVEEVIVAIESSEHSKLNQIMNWLSDHNVVIKIIPDIYDIIIGSVKIHNVFGAPLIEIYPDLMPNWQRLLKRSVDVIISLIILVILSPCYLFIALRVRLSSPGPIIYAQERVGQHGKPFRIYKFRSMYQDAEKDGPALSSEQDQRVTPWGRVMRKWRLDELPQFFNVLRGEMSLVGPRPERRHYIDKILKRAPHYKHLHKVKPGITSLGMVKFGYASSVNQMIARMRYDILYIENMSLALDLKVMLFTVWTIVQGEGR